jgi:hypothetical protein
MWLKNVFLINHDVYLSLNVVTTKFTWNYSAKKQTETIFGYVWHTHHLSRMAAITISRKFIPFGMITPLVWLPHWYDYPIGMITPLAWLPHWYDYPIGMITPSYQRGNHTNGVIRIVYCCFIISQNELKF